ncbi:protein SCO1 [Frankia sp. AiPs1]|uniref:SCO family protein n=1 Tax=Frankia sp. AiPa1 TaxID=573492 RepID=UPI00202B692C|nr:SCO family protein [Frankia sp. AiPa1]MCL9762411.1 SCO family protein [Frankia sp. AiPa1]
MRDGPRESDGAGPVPPRSRRRLAAAGSALALASVLLVGACAGSGTDDTVRLADAGGVDASGGGGVAGGDGLHGIVPERRLAKPALNLTDTAGAPFDLRARTEGKIVLLFFGYTRCPDVCPTTMADLAAALGEMKPNIRTQIAVVFATTDPDRDSGPVLARWLRQFDASFIGVRGPFDQVQGQAEALGVPLARPRVQADGSVLVTHGSQVIAFARDDRVRALYLAGTSIQNYIDDLPRLAAEPAGPERT